MKEKLIKLAKEKGFESWFLDTLVQINNDNVIYYLWLCELQYWIEENFELFITTDTGLTGNSWRFNLYLKQNDGNLHCIIDGQTSYKSKILLLESSLFESLNLIP